MAETIEKIKPSIVAVGTLKQTNSPHFVLRRTGFVVGNGSLVATNAHVVPERADSNDPVIVIQTRSINGELQLKRAQLVSPDKEHDLAVLQIEGPALLALTHDNSDSVREEKISDLQDFRFAAHSCSLQ